MGNSEGSCTSSLIKISLLEVVRLVVHGYSGTGQIWEFPKFRGPNTNPEKRNYAPHCRDSPKGPLILGYPAVY